MTGAVPDAQEQGGQEQLRSPSGLHPGTARSVREIVAATDRSVAARRFWEDTTRAPVLGETGEVNGRVCRLVTFVWRQPDGDRDVMVHLNGVTDAYREDVTPALLEQVPGTDLWHRSLWLPVDGTWGYRIVDAPDIPRDAGTTRQGWLAIHRAGQRDPLNPRWLPHALGEKSSVLVMPEAWQHPAWLDEPTLEEPWTHWQIPDPGASGESRQVRYWSPPDGRSRRLLVLFDGEQWAAIGLADAVVRAGLDLELLLIDSVDPARRARDLPDPARASALVEAALNRRAGFCGPRDPDEVVIAGQSFGGLASAGVGVTRPDLASRVVVQSGSFWHVQGDEPRRGNPAPGDLVRRIASGEFGRLTTRFVIQAGTDEGTMVDQAHHFHAACTAVGASADIAIVTGGHDFAWWTHHLFRALADDLARVPPG